MAPSCHRWTEHTLQAAASCQPAMDQQAIHGVCNLVVSISSAARRLSSQSSSLSQHTSVAWHADMHEKAGMTEQHDITERTASNFCRFLGVQSKLTMDSIVSIAASVYTCCCSLVMCCLTICMTQVHECLAGKSHPVLLAHYYLMLLAPSHISSSILSCNNALSDSPAASWACRTAFLTLGELVMTAAMAAGAAAAVEQAAKTLQGAAEATAAVATAATALQGAAEAAAAAARAAEAPARALPACSWDLQGHVCWCVQHEAGQKAAPHHSQLQPVHGTSIATLVPGMLGEFPAAAEAAVLAVTSK